VAQAYGLHQGDPAVAQHFSILPARVHMFHKHYDSPMLLTTILQQNLFKYGLKCSHKGGQIQLVTMIAMRSTGHETGTQEETVIHREGRRQADLSPRSSTIVLQH
jgi:hypothetical protein